MFSLLLFLVLHYKYEANATAGFLLGETAVLPRPIIDAVSMPKSIPSVPAIPHYPIVPPIAIPRADLLRNPNLPQVTISSSHRKEAYEKWKRAVEHDYKEAGGNGGKGSRKPDKNEHHPNGHPNGKGSSRQPHFQTDKNKLKPNTPQKHFPYSVTISPGDTLWGIANKYGLNSKTLQSLNGIKDPTKLKVGQVIKLGK